MNFDFSQADLELKDAVRFLKEEFLHISTGRANPSLLDGVMVESYGSKQPIKNIASIGLEDARTMKITPWDRSQMQAIERALHDSQLPFSVSVSDSGVRVNIPQLTEESKKSLVKLAKEKLEDARVRVRNTRQDTMKDIEAAEKNGDFAEDQKNRYKDELQKKVDTTNNELQGLFESKEADIMKV